MKKDSKTVAMYAAARAALEKIAGKGVLQEQTATGQKTKALTLDQLGAALTRRVKNDGSKNIGVFEVSPIDLNAYGAKVKHADEYRKKQEEEQAKEAEKKREEAKAAGVNAATKPAPAKSENAKPAPAKPAPAKAEEVKTPTQTQKVEQEAQTPSPAPSPTPEPTPEPAPFFVSIEEDDEGGVDYEATVKVMQSIASITLEMLDTMEAQGK